MFIVIDWLTKKRHYISYTIDKNKISAEAISRILLNNVDKFYGLFLSLILDQGLQIILKIWINLCKISDIKVYLSITFPQETDRQSEIANGKMENHLCMFLTITKMTGLRN